MLFHPYSSWRAPVTWRAFQLCLIIMSAACGQDNAVEPAAAATAGLGAIGSAGAGGSDSKAATWTEVYEMLFPMSTNGRCVACHGNPPNDVANGNLSVGMVKDSAYAALVGKHSTSSRCMQRAFVVPSAPDQSLLLNKLSANPACGSRMPLGGTPLNAAQLDTVRSWVAAGAKAD